MTADKDGSPPARPPARPRALRAPRAPRNAKINAPSMRLAVARAPRALTDALRNRCLHSRAAPVARAHAPPAEPPSLIAPPPAKKKKWNTSRQPPDHHGAQQVRAHAGARQLPARLANAAHHVPRVVPRLLPVRRVLLLVRLFSAEEAAALWGHEPVPLLRGQPAVQRAVRRAEMSQLLPRRRGDALLCAVGRQHALRHSGRAAHHEHAL